MRSRSALQAALTRAELCHKLLALLDGGQSFRSLLDLRATFSRVTVPILRTQEVLTGGGDEPAVFDGCVRSLLALLDVAIREGHSVSEFRDLVHCLLIREERNACRIAPESESSEIGRPAPSSPASME